MNRAVRAGAVQVDAISVVVVIAPARYHELLRLRPDPPVGGEAALDILNHVRLAALYSNVARDVCHAAEADGR